MNYMTIQLADIEHLLDAETKAQLLKMRDITAASGVTMTFMLNEYANLCVVIMQPPINPEVEAKLRAVYRQVCDRTALLDAVPGGSA